MIIFDYIVSALEKEAAGEPLTSYLSPLTSFRLICFLAFIHPERSSQEPEQRAKQHQMFIGI